MPAETIGKYHVLQPLGKGGMAEVYKARDSLLDRFVAIKVILPDLSARKGFEKMFRHEAKVVASLRHPNIVQLYDFDILNHQPYMVMEFLEGGSLTERLKDLHNRKTTMPFDEIMHVIKLLANALDSAHARGVVHLDIKPANILFLSDREPILSDFGLAKLVVPSSSTGFGGVVAGTPVNMSPEQAAGKPVSASSDLYSFGSVIYEMVCGRPPFRSGSLKGFIKSHINDPPPSPQTFNPDIPDEAQAALLKTLAKNPEDRFSTVSEFAEAFNASLSQANTASSLSQTITMVLPTITDSADDTPVNVPSISHNLPIQSTPFIGRTEEKNAILQRLDEPTCRLLTLLGPGGFGKTRLSIESASERIEKFIDGVFFVQLAPLSSPEFLISAVAESIRFAFYGDEAPKDQLLNHLRNKHMLLVMDNFEHILEGTDLIAEILQTAANVNVLATSRERLNLQGEFVLEISGLKVPEGEDVEDPDSYAAIQLFVDRAQQANASFALTDSEKNFVIRICRLVHGIPLGIELTAAWVRMFSTQEIANEISTNLDFLTSSLRNVPERHRSLRGVFDYSWKLLSEQEQMVLRNLAVFRGGFHKEAARKSGRGIPFRFDKFNRQILAT